jgi:hypothetical protein
MNTSKNKWFRTQLFGVLVVALIAVVWAPIDAHATIYAPTINGPKPTRVLFIGNSYTKFNMLPMLVTKLARSAVDGRAIPYTMSAKPGYTLQMHWKRHEALRLIRTGRFSHVIIQAHSLDPIDRPAQLTEYLDKFVREANKAGAQVILVETWARHPENSIYRYRPTLTSYEAMFQRIDDVFQKSATHTQVRIAPVGQAFRRVMAEHPDIDLYRTDGSHPSWAGSYLASCVIFGVLTGHSPRTTSYIPWEISPAQAESLKEIADRVLEPATLQ